MTILSEAISSNSPPQGLRPNINPTVPDSKKIDFVGRNNTFYSIKIHNRRKRTGRETENIYYSCKTDGSRYDRRRMESSTGNYTDTRRTHKTRHQSAKRKVLRN